MLGLKEKVRSLSAAELGVSPTKSGITKFASAGDPIRQNRSEIFPLLEDEDPVYSRVMELLSDGFAGVVLSGVPGTGKSWYAREISRKITENDGDRQFFAQFHPGYQYEDFIIGFVPDGNGGFVPEEKIFLKACDKARDISDPVVLVIDELSRTDVIRVFGEALTYLEKSKRELRFTLASGRTIYIPSNLIVIGTMNPWDRGVEELDLAFERRFAKVRIDPSPDALKGCLVGKGLEEALVQKFVQFFQMLANSRSPLCRIGHAYFMNVSSVESLRRVWDNQLQFHFEKVLRHDEEELAAIVSAWARVFEQ